MIRSVLILALAASACSVPLVASALTPARIALTTAKEASAMLKGGSEGAKVAAEVAKATEEAATLSKEAAVLSKEAAADAALEKRLAQKAAETAQTFIHRGYTVRPDLARGGYYVTHPGGGITTYFPTALAVSKFIDGK